MGQERPDHGVTGPPIRGTGPVPQCRLMAEAQFARHRETPDVMRIAVDFHPCDVVDGKRHLRERGGGLCRESLVEGVLVHPIPNFTRPHAPTGVESTAPKHPMPLT